MARQWFQEAYVLGGDHDSILEGLAVISLETGNPSRAGTGRLLWATTSASGPLLLAAELLQIDGRMAESRDILERIEAADLSPEEQQRLALRLGDARFYDRYKGNVEHAALAWDGASPEMARSRDLFLELHQTGADPVQWWQLIPSLVQASMHRSDSGAEALYLLFQIDSKVGAREDAINDLALILQRYPQKAAGSDVPERFWRVYSNYVQELAAAGLHFDIAALHETVWNSTVKRAIRAPEALVDVARAYQKVGLPLRALTVLRDATQVLLEHSSDDKQLLLQLAQLYADVGESAGRLPVPAAERFDGKPVEDDSVSSFGGEEDEVWQVGLDTVEYLRKRNDGEIAVAEIDLLESRMHMGRGDFEAASAALVRATRDAEVRDQAYLQLALLDAARGRCGAALPTLRRLAVADSEEPAFADTRPWLALARCEIASGSRSRAADAARRAAVLAEEKLLALGDGAGQKAESADEEGATRLEVPAEARLPEVSGSDRSTGNSWVPGERCENVVGGEAVCSSKLRGQLREILEAEMKYALGLAAVAEGWQESDVTTQLQGSGGIWAAIANDFSDDREFQEQVDARGLIPWESQ
jgi:tetratricopeptide (TPR) repeat protein